MQSTKRCRVRGTPGLSYPFFSSLCSLRVFHLRDRAAARFPRPLVAIARFLSAPVPGARATHRLSLTLGALLGLLVASPAAGQQPWGSLSGQVVDPHNQPVAGATVRLYARNSSVEWATTTPLEGAYRFDRVPPGEYLLEAKTANFALAGAATVRIGPGEDKRWDVAMAISTLRTQVIVTASSTPLSLDEVSKASDVVDAEQIRARGEFSIAEAVRNVPGLRVQQHSGPGSLATVQMRGLRNEDTAVLIDGLRFRDAASTQSDATAFLQDVMVVDTERVEILRGSGSSLYGTNAMGGVLNINTRQGGGRTHGEMTAEGGGLGMLRGVARVGGGLGGDRFLYSGGLSHLNVTSGVDGFDPYRNTSGQGFARYDLTPRISLSGRIFASDAFGALNESPLVEDVLVANQPPSGAVPAIGLPAFELRRYETNQPFSPANATSFPASTTPTTFARLRSSPAP